MKRILIALAALSLALSAFGQEASTPSLWQLVTRQEKTNEAFNVYLNFSGAFQETLNPAASQFKGKDLRLDIGGTLGQHFLYRFRYNFLAKTTDYMAVGWKFSDRMELSAGKMKQIWGTFELGENPVYIYQYSEFAEHMDYYLPGIMLAWRPVPSQEIAVMVSNSFNSQRLYAGFEKSAHPLSYLLSWNGRMFGGRLNTRWAAGVQTMAKGQYSFMATLGQQLAFKRFQFNFDYLGEWDQVDRLGIVTRELGFNSGVQYHTLIAKANWQFLPRWNLMGKGMYELSSLSDNEYLTNYRLSVGWVGSLEFYPWKGQDLRIFLAYVGKNLHYTQASGLFNNNGTTHRVELGVMYRIKAY